MCFCKGHAQGLPLQLLWPAPLTNHIPSIVFNSLYPTCTQQKPRIVFLPLVKQQSHTVVVQRSHVHLDSCYLLFPLVASEDVYANMMKSSTCYSIIPSSTKIVVFDTRLRVSSSHAWTCILQLISLIVRLTLLFSLPSCFLLA